MEARWRIELLGWLRAVGDGQVVSRFRSRQTGALLAYLAFHRHRSHPRDTLVELLWPECDWDAGRNRFRVALSSLRHQLEPPGIPAGAVLIADRSSLQLNPAVTTTDVAEFEAALQSADRAGNPLERVQRLGQAVALYRGELLPGYFDPWILPERRRLAETCLNAIAELVAHHEAIEDLPGALQWARRAVAADPLREESYRHLIRLLMATDEPGAALRQYEELTTLLERELGEEPSEETRALAAQARSREPEFRDRSAAAAAPVGKPAANRADLAPPEPRAPTGTVTLLVAETTPRLELSAAGPPPMGTHLETAGKSPRDSVMAPRLDPLRSVLREHGGEELASAGGMLTVAFGRASDAASAGLAIIREAKTASAAASIRLALHTGEVGPNDERGGGEARRHAVRLLHAAHQGQALVSPATAAILRSHLPDGAQLIDLGLYYLGTAEPSSLSDGPERLYQLTGVDDTPPFARPQARPASPSRLPAQFTRLFGRDAEIAHLEELLCGSGAEDRTPGAPCRLVTLTGPGGTGKTRLALAVAERLQERFSGRVWSAPLAALSEARLIPVKVLEALSLAGAPDREPLDQLVEALAESVSTSGARSLLLLDNFEQLVEEGAQTVQRLLERVPGLTLLVTSRRLLHLPAEREFAVTPLPVPVSSGQRVLDTQDGPSLPTTHYPLATLTHCPSVALFVDRAQSVRPDFQVTPANAEAVAHLCARLEGIPLALELAAARTRILTPAQMLSRLQPRLDLLVSRGRAAEPRHHSLRAALDWSYQLLSPDLQRFFASLSVFRSGWTLAAAESVCGGEGGGGSVLEQLEQLLECSLIFEEVPPPGTDPEEPRFRFLETVQEYAVDQLPAAERATLSRRHASFYRQLAETAEMELLGAAQARWLERLDREHDNIRAALDWAEESGEVKEGLSLAGTLWGFWWLRGSMIEGRQRLERLLAQEELKRGSSPVAAQAGAKEEGAEGARQQPSEPGLRAARARALACSGVLAHFQGDYATARDFYEESLAIQRELGNRWGMAFALTGLGFLAQRRGDLAVARDMQGAGLPLWRELGIEPGIAWSLNSMADVAHQQGDLTTARSLFEESLRIRRRVGDDWGAAFALSGLGLVAADQGDLEAAQALLEESLQIRRKLGDRPDIALSLQHLGDLAHLRGDQGVARARLEECLAIQREIGNRLGLAMSLISLAHLALLHGDTAKTLPLLEEALQIQREIDHRPGVAAALYLLGRVALRSGQWTHARQRLLEGLCLRHELGEPAGVADCLEALAGVEAAAGSAVAAARLFAAAFAAREALGIPVPASVQDDYDGWVASARSRLDAGQWAVAWEKGQTWDLGHAVAAALPPRQIPDS